jgi:DNA replication protein DnaC
MLTFVPHQKLGDAEKILEEEHCLIVSGEPGIGKTTMAEMLALRLLEAGYRTHFVANIEELERQTSPNGKHYLFTTTS